MIKVNKIVKPLLTIASLIWIGYVCYTLSFSFITFNLLYFVVGIILWTWVVYLLGRHDVYFRIKQFIIRYVELVTNITKSI